MKQETKISVYQEIYSELKENPKVSGLGYPKEKVNFDFYFDFAGMHVSFSLMEGADLFRLETSRIYPGTSDEQLEAICSGLEHDCSIRFSYYNETITFKHTHPLAGKPDDVACREIKEATRAFMCFLEKNKGKLDMRAYVPAVPVEKTSIHSLSKGEDNGNADSILPDLAEHAAGREDGGSNTKESMDTAVPAKNEKHSQKVSLKTAPAEAVEDGTDEQSLHICSEKKPVDEKAGGCKAEQAAEPYPPAVAGQMKTMYADMDKVFQTKKEQMDYREETLNKRGAILDFRESEIDSRMEALKNMEEQLDVRGAEYHAREQQLAAREESVAAGERGLEERKRYVDSLEQEKSQMDVGLLCKQVTDLKNSLSKQETRAAQMEELALAEQSARNDIQQKFEELKMQYDEKDDELGQCKREVNSLKEQLEHVQSVLHETEKKAVETAGTTGQKDLSTAAIAILSDMGIIGGVISDGGINVCSGTVVLRIRPDINMLRAEVPVKRGNRYQNTVAEWNTEDETAVFLVHDRKIECQVCYPDLRCAVRDVLDKFSGIK